MIKACIFDMDGTTVNTINSIAYFANNALNKAGLPSIDTDTYKIMVGNGAKVLVERMIKNVGADEKYFEEVAKEYNTTYDNDFLYLTEPYDGIIDMLKKLKDMGIKVTILSNKPHATAVKVSNALFADKLVDICYGARDGVALKPDPAGVFEIMDELGLNTDECVYIGDTSTDMKTGKSAELYTVGVLWGFRGRQELEESGADAIISHPSELIDIINKLNS
ncbi:MAG: HAD family hydrolase [Ruminococcaceae bacterium]|nr:HAD family hydrolase [Oscillospiraceae bacterium]